MRVFLAAFASIVLSVAAQFLLKAGVTGATKSPDVGAVFSAHGLLQMLANPKVILGFILYAVGALVWLVVLTSWEVSKAYPLVGLGFIATVGVGLLTGEHVSLLRTLGVVFIAMGVLMISRT